jgi:hypothetical protein
MLTILFMAHSGVVASATWEQWKSISSENVRFMVHCEPNSVKHGVNFCRKYKTRHVGSARSGSISIVKEISKCVGEWLVKYSPHSEDFIIILSGSDVPLKPPQDVLRLFSNGGNASAAFCFSSDVAVKVNVKEGSFMFRPHTTWYVLSRSDAVVISAFKHWDRLKLSTKIEIESVRPTIDKWAIYAALTWKDAGRIMVDNNMSCAVTYAAILHTEFGKNSNHPITWNKTDQIEWSERIGGKITWKEVLRDAKSDPSVFFVRKVGPDLVLSEHIPPWV